MDNEEGGEGMRVIRVLVYEGDEQFIKSLNIRAVKGVMEIPGIGKITEHFLIQSKLLPLLENDLDFIEGSDSDKG